MQTDMNPKCIFPLKVFIASCEQCIRVTCLEVGYIGCMLHTVQNFYKNGVSKCWTQALMFLMHKQLPETCSEVRIDGAIRY